MWTLEALDLQVLKPLYRVKGFKTQKVLKEATMADDMTQREVADWIVQRLDKAIKIRFA